MPLDVHSSPFFHFLPEKTKTYTKSYKIEEACYNVAVQCDTPTMPGSQPAPQVNRFHSFLMSIAPQSSHMPPKPYTKSCIYAYFLIFLGPIPAIAPPKVIRILSALDFCPKYRERLPLPPFSIPPFFLRILDYLVV